MIAHHGTFSADVRLHLRVNGSQYELGHLGPGFAMFSEIQSLQIEQAELETIIDGESSRWPIRITSPITTDTKRFTFESAS